MAYFLVYDGVLGTATARPVLRWGECDASVVAAQAVDTNDVAITIADLSAFDGITDDEFETESDYYFTYNVTTPAINPVTRTDNLDIVAERVFSQIRQILADTAWTQTIEGALTDGKFLDWINYRAAIRDLVNDINFPDGITWPTPPDSITGTNSLQISEGDSEPLWQRVYRKTNVVGTVSKTGLAVPTGALMEAGSNANGRWRRYACGFQICWHTLSSPLAATTTWTFPIAFSGANIAMAIAPRILSGVEIMVPSYQIPTTSKLDFAVLNGSGTRIERVCELMAIGNW